MKKWIALLLALLLLTGCGFQGSKKTDSTDREQLQAILDDLAQNLHRGTAGSSLTATRLAADLAIWAKNSKMDKKEAVAVVGAWLKEQAPDIRDAFQEKLESVGSYFADIARDGAKDMLDAVGVEQDLSNLGQRVKELVQAVLDSGGID